MSFWKSIFLIRSDELIYDNQLDHFLTFKKELLKGMGAVLASVTPSFYEVDGKRYIKHKVNFYGKQTKNPPNKGRRRSA